MRWGAVLSYLPSLPSWPWLLRLRGWLCPGQRPLLASLPAAVGLAAKAMGRPMTVSAAMVKTEASASAGGAGFGAWRPDSAAPGHGAEPDMVGHTGGDDGSDIGRCQSRRRWSNAASACGGVTRAAESGPALRGPVGGGGGRRSCAAATCSRRVDAPLKGLPWGAGTMAMAVNASTGPASRPGDCARGFLGESLGDGDAVGRRFPVGGVVFPH